LSITGDGIMHDSKKLVIIFEEKNEEEFAQSLKDKPLIICANDDIKRIYSDLGFDVRTIMEYSSTQN